MVINFYKSKFNLTQQLSLVYIFNKFKTVLLPIPTKTRPIVETGLNPSVFLFFRFLLPVPTRLSGWCLSGRDRHMPTEPMPEWGNLCLTQTKLPLQVTVLQLIAPQIWWWLSVWFHQIMNWSHDNTHKGWNGMLWHAFGEAEIAANTTLFSV